MEVEEVLEAATGAHTSERTGDVALPGTRCCVCGEVDSVKVSHNSGGGASATCVLQCTSVGCQEVLVRPERRLTVVYAHTSMSPLSRPTASHLADADDDDGVDEAKASAVMPCGTTSTKRHRCTCSCPQADAAAPDGWLLTMLDDIVDGCDAKAASPLRLRPRLTPPPPLPPLARLACRLDFDCICDAMVLLSPRRLYSKALPSCCWSRACHKTSESLDWLPCCLKLFKV